MSRSRVNRKLVRRTERNLFYILAGGFVLVILLAIFGSKLLVNFSLFVEKKSDPTTPDPTSKLVLVPPILDPMEDATNSATINISGIAGSGKYVTLYLNGSALKKADIKKDSSFLFKDIQLEDGQNLIKVKSFAGNPEEESEFSNTVNITYSNKPPSLNIAFPQDGETYHKDNNPLKVSGSTDPNTKVTVNDFWAMISDDGNFYYNLPLKNGDNQITVQATTDAGNTTSKILKISYSE